MPFREPAQHSNLLTPEEAQTMAKNANRKEGRGTLTDLLSRNLSSLKKPNPARRPLTPEDMIARKRLDQELLRAEHLFGSENFFGPKHVTETFKIKIVPEEIPPLPSLDILGKVALGDRLILRMSVDSKKLIEAAKENHVYPNKPTENRLKTFPSIKSEWVIIKKIDLKINVHIGIGNVHVKDFCSTGELDIIYQSPAEILYDILLTQAYQVCICWQREIFKPKNNGYEGLGVFIEKNTEKSTDFDLSIVGCSRSGPDKLIANIYYTT